MAQRGSAGTRGRLQQLKETLARTKKLWILIHNNPDPDAMAGAWSLKHVVEKVVGCEAAIVYGGVIGRPDNRAMVHALEIPLLQLEGISIRRGDRFACIDTQPGVGNTSFPEGARVAVVIDHHPPVKGLKAPFLDVQPDVGAVATIMTEYLYAARITPGRRLATALAYAIATETADLVRTENERDVKAYGRLLLSVDHRILGALRHPRVGRSTYATMAMALRNARLFHDVVICHLDRVNNPDEVAQVADLLNALQGSRWVLCTGVHENILAVSLRTTDEHRNAGRLLAQAVGGEGGAGGHGMVAGGQMAIKEGEGPGALRHRLVGGLLVELGYDRNAVFEPLVPEGGAG